MSAKSEGDIIYNVTSVLTLDGYNVIQSCEGEGPWMLTNNNDYS